MTKIINYAFIDGQNLNMGLKWALDLKKFKIFLKKRFNVEKAYYFLGFKSHEAELYKNLQEAGFILVFNEKSENLKSQKKGNIDVCLAFNVMRSLIDDKFDRVIIVSGDGDFKILVDYLLLKNKFERIIFPNKKKSSSLYKTLSFKYTYLLDNAKERLEYKK